MKIKKHDIDGGKGFDWGRISEDYAQFRDVYPNAFYEKIRQMGLCVSGQRVLDLGTGTGVLPRNLYAYGAEFTGSDISEKQIKQARLLAAQENMNISFVVMPAEELDFPEDSFDTVTACQCYEYFDKAAVFSAVHSVLKASGHFCILYMGWLPEESDIVSGSESIVLKHNPSWSASGMKRFVYEFPKQAQGLFELEDSIVFDCAVTFNRTSWHGRIKACRGIGASSLTKTEIVSFEKEHIEYLSKAPETFEIPHFISILNLRKK